MSGSFNRATLCGHLGRDPETRRTGSGDPVVTLNVATSETWKDKNTGERKEKTEWHSVVIWNENLCRIAEQYLKKGSKVLVEGKIATRKWQDQASGQDRYRTEIVLEKFGGTLVLMGDPGPKQGPSPDNYGTVTSRPAGQSYADTKGRSAPSGAGGPRSFASDLDDDIPFGPETRG